MDELKVFQIDQGLLMAMIAIFIANVFINLFFVDQYFTKSRKIKSLMKSIRDKEELIKEYLADQFSMTKKLKFFFPDIDLQLYREVIALRSAYLKIEEKALNYGLGSFDFWKTINDQLYKLIKILCPELFGKNIEFNKFSKQVETIRSKMNVISDSDHKSVSTRKRIDAALTHVVKEYKNTSSDRGKLHDKLDKINYILTLYEDPKLRGQYINRKQKINYADSSENQVELIKRNSLESIETIESIEASLLNQSLKLELEKFKEEHAKLNVHVKNLKLQLSSLKDQGNHDLAMIRQYSAIGKDYTAEVSDVSDELLEKNEKEVGRLRDVISNQRQSILEMEQTLSHLNDTQRNENQEDIEKLKKYIKESEMCIEILENELNQLKQQIDDLKVNKVPEFTDREVSELNDEINSLKESLTSNSAVIEQKTQLLEYVTELLSASSVEDISFTIYEAIVQLNFSPSVLIHSPTRLIELAKSGQVASRDKVLINTMRVNEFNSDSSGVLSFKLISIGGILRPNSPGDKQSDNHQYFTSLLRIADKIIQQLISVNKSKKMDQIINSAMESVKHASFDLDKILERYSSQTKQGVVGSFKQVKDMARVRGFSATQIAALQSIEQELIRQLEADDIVRLKSRKKLLDLLNDMKKGVDQ